VEDLHPSEDGEALRTIAHTNSRIERIPSPSINETSTAPNWFAVYTTCRHEKRIAQHFTQRQIEHYLPLYRSERKWRDGSRVTLDLPLFPGYIFVHIRKSERVSVLSVPGALAVVGGTRGEPAPLPDLSIEALRAGLAERRVEPHPFLRIGQQARVRSGAFAGMQGVVVRKKSKFRVVLTFDLIMQSIAVEMDEHDLEPIGANETFGFDTGALGLGFCLQSA
jgi:transcription antitermination factor NusG